MTSEYGISKHRFYELKHFCLQYPEWKRQYADADGWSGEGDTTSRDGIKRAEMGSYISLIESCADRINSRLLAFVVTGAKIPSELCFNYKRFFWELSQLRN